MLTTGWTRMICLFLDPNTGYMIAKYANQEITDLDWKYPACAAYTQKRNILKFKPWDGAPKKEKTMRYKSVGKTTTVYGDLKGKTNDGWLIIELDCGAIVVAEKDEFVEDIPQLFAAKAIGGSSNYRCYYEMPRNADITTGDVLLSSTGNIYMVTAVDVGYRHTNKGAFTGRRLVTADL